MGFDEGVGGKDTNVKKGLTGIHNNGDIALLKKEVFATTKSRK